MARAGPSPACSIWACKKRHITFNPVTGMERPKAEPRVAYITPERWERIVAAANESDPFLDLLILLRETGCRANEAKRLEKRHFKPDNETWTYPKDESKGKKCERVVPLNSRALEITPTGAQTSDRPATAKHGRHAPDYVSIANQFRRLRDELEIPKLCGTATRHTFITDALKRGVPVKLIEALSRAVATCVTERRKDRGAGGEAGADGAFS